MAVRQCSFGVCRKVIFTSSPRSCAPFWRCEGEGAFLPDLTWRAPMLHDAAAIVSAEVAFAAQVGPVK